MSVEQTGGKPGAIEKFIAWLPPQRHYRKFEEKVAAMSNEELVNARARYNHVDRTTVVISGLVVGAAVGGTIILGRSYPVEVYLYCPAPTLLGVGLLGPARGNIRRGERDILDEQIAHRGLQQTDTPSSPLPALQGV